MLYLGIDQHARQLTVLLRDQHSDVLLARQVSTRPVRLMEFFERHSRSFARARDCRSRCNVAFPGPRCMAGHQSVEPRSPRRSQNGFSSRPTSSARLK